MFQGWVNKQQLNAYHHLHTYITSSVTLRWLQQQQQLYYNVYCVDISIRLWTLLKTVYKDMNSHPTLSQVEQKKTRTLTNKIVQMWQSFVSCKEDM